MSSSGANNLKKLLDKCDLSVAELSRRSGVTATTLYNVLSGQRLLSRVNVSDTIAIASALGVTVEELLSGEEVTLDRELSFGELNLITRYRRLNEVGRQKVVDYVSDLEATELYKEPSNQHDD